MMFRVGGAPQEKKVARNHGCEAARQVSSRAIVGARSGRTCRGPTSWQAGDDGAKLRLHLRANGPGVMTDGESWQSEQPWLARARRTDLTAY